MKSLFLEEWYEKKKLIFVPFDTIIDASCISDPHIWIKNDSGEWIEITNTLIK